MKLAKLWNVFLEAAEKSGRARVRRQLLALEDRLLADAGFSRELLELGVEAWPWRAPQDVDRPSRPLAGRAQEEREIATAAEALRRYSDAELTELGIARSDIDRVVREGRAGIDDRRNDRRNDRRDDRRAA